MRDAIAFLQNKAEDARREADDQMASDFDQCAAEIERLRVALKEIQAYSVGDPLPRHTWYYDRAEAALNHQQSAAPAVPGCNGGYIRENPCAVCGAKIDEPCRATFR